MAVTVRNWPITIDYSFIVNSYGYNQLTKFTLL